MESPTPSGERVLVTGGAGFVGSHLVEALVEENDVVVLDDLSTGSRSHLPAEATLVEGDVRDDAALERAARDVDLIYHQAAIVSVERTVDSPRATNRTNLDGSLAVLERARIEDARVVLASSAAIYGEPTEVPVAETAPADPLSPYGVQKLAADEYAARYEALYDLPTVSLRYFNVYGPRQRGPYSGVISAFFSKANAGEPLTVDGDGKQTRDFVYVDDVVRANLLAAETTAVGEAFNVASGERASIRELAETVRELTGTSVPIVHGEPRPGDVRHSVADLTKSTEVLGYEPRVDLIDGLNSLFDSAQRSDESGPGQHSTASE